MTDATVDIDDPAEEKNPCCCNVDGFVRTYAWTSIFTFFLVGLGLGIVLGQKCELESIQDQAQDLGKKLKFW